MTISFFVAGLPKSMSVGKTVRVPMRERPGSVRQFQERTHTEWATLVGHVGRVHAPSAPCDGPMTMDVDFYLPRPQSASRKIELPTKRPDLDNLCHKLADQWTGVFWHDDAQIVEMVMRKRFAVDGRAGAFFTIKTVSAAQFDMLLYQQAR